MLSVFGAKKPFKDGETHFCQIGPHLPPPPPRDEPPPPLIKRVWVCREGLKYRNIGQN